MLLPDFVLYHIRILLLPIPHKPRILPNSTRCPPSTHGHVLPFHAFQLAQSVMSWGFACEQRLTIIVSVLDRGILRPGLIQLRLSVDEPEIRPPEASRFDL